MRGCNYYDYCESGHDPDNPSVQCSSDWNSYCYSVTDPLGIREVCLDSSAMPHAEMECEWS